MCAYTCYKSLIYGLILNSCEIGAFPEWKVKTKKGNLQAAVFLFSGQDAHLNTRAVNLETFSKHFFSAYNFFSLSKWRRRRRLTKNKINARRRAATTTTTILETAADSGRHEKTNTNTQRNFAAQIKRRTMADKQTSRKANAKEN